MNINIYFLMGLWGGARGLSSHLDKSSIFKMNLIETPSPLRPHIGIFPAFPLTLVMKQTSLAYRQSFPSCRVCFTIDRLHKKHLYSIPIQNDGYICLRMCAAFTGLNLSFSQRVRIRNGENIREWDGMCWGPHLTPGESLVH